MASLTQHVEQLDWVIPGWVSVTGADHRITVFRDVAGRAVLNRAIHRPVILPMVQNAKDGDWDGAGSVALFADATARRAFLDRLVPFLAANHAGGAFFDFESLPAGAQANYRLFLAEAKARFAPRGWVVAIAAPVGNVDWNMRAYARVTDKIFLMAYDEHVTSGPAGPIASQRWFARSVANAARGVAPSKLVVAFGSYAYDWHDRGGDALGVEEAWQAASDSGTVPTFDKGSGTGSFAYADGGTRHQVWLLDAASAYNELAFLQKAGCRASRSGGLGRRIRRSGRSSGATIADCPARVRSIRPRPGRMSISRAMARS
ncbi:glycosyl hydrolase family 18 protein [Sphingomonas aerolata]|uniref:glycosyl hydrolase family 18 protein n=1 Tax=Sphingomonas aerolata TaxID=185951 RepID=UPI002FE2C188